MANLTREERDILIQLPGDGFTRPVFGSQSVVESLLERGLMRDKAPNSKGAIWATLTDSGKAALEAEHVRRELLGVTR